MNKEQKTRDCIPALRKLSPNENELERKSEKMAELAEGHHKKLQEEDVPANRSDHRRKMRKVLSKIKTKIKAEQKEVLSALITRDEVETAISKLHSGKAAGLDGIVHELWKELTLRYEDAQKEEKQGFDIAGAMTRVFQDIQLHGMESGTKFAEGWMCPLYKKGDKTNIGNYRPITVLNTDYKIMTKALTLKLGEIAPDIIHRDQAGFMHGRRIEDQTELARTVINWCELTERNGMIVCLDQEKAYDKILHVFLWRAMKRFGIPKEFIDTIKALYSDAYTKVILNGEISKGYKVT